MADTLASVEFDTPFIVRPGGTIEPAPAVYAPSVFHDDETDVTVDGPDWRPLRGYTGQYGYSGAVMHPSEYLGGRLAADILAEPGVYVVVAVEVMPDDDDDSPEPAGWAVLRYEPRKAGLGVGHVWTATSCPAYATLYPPDCTCGRPTPRGHWSACTADCNSSHCRTL